MYVLAVTSRLVAHRSWLCLVVLVRGRSASLAQRRKRSGAVEAESSQFKDGRHNATVQRPWRHYSQLFAEETRMEESLREDVM
ncbi:hypothetical protein C8Q72DRAFT_47643 [Fomitopsis betulina]|nr:hypothetical protein C8Q72DRAFT_47643 [Fomitopsis betulina]